MHCKARWAAGSWPMAHPQVAWCNPPQPPASPCRPPFRAPPRAGTTRTWLDRPLFPIKKSELLITHHIIANIQYLITHTHIYIYLYDIEFVHTDPVRELKAGSLTYAYYLLPFRQRLGADGHLDSVRNLTMSSDGNGGITLDGTFQPPEVDA